jgi:two-component system, NarL family, sensor kinase
MDKEVVILLIGGTIFFSFLGTGLILFVRLYRQQYLVYQKRQEELKNTFRQEILQAQLEIQEQTLQNISQEIHDNIGQVLSLAKLHLATMDLSFDPFLEVKVQDSKSLVGKAIQDLRNLSHSLNTDFINETGLPGALENELEIIRKSRVYETIFSVDGAIQKLDKQKELILFRITQELINNIIKHAKAKKINVRLLYRPDYFSLTVADDGEGFDLTPQNQNNNFGLGIKNMNNRAKLIGAAFTMTSASGKGTTAEIVLPASYAKAEKL